METITYMTVLGVRKLVVKISWHDTAKGELDSLHFVARNTTILVPTVYDFWIHPRKDYPDLGIIVMQRLPGKSLLRR